jgi:uncharacterized protein (DUF433 family)
MKRTTDRTGIFERPTYGLAEAAHYLAIPVTTIRSWLHGRPYPTKTGVHRFQPLIHLAAGHHLLSFQNLVEFQIVRGLRKAYGIDVSKIREAIAYAKKTFNDAHPLLNPQMQTDGVDLFWRWAQIENLNRGGQFAIKEILDAHLKRVSWSKGIPVRLFPFRRWDETTTEAMPVMIDPAVSFGRPVLIGSGVPTAIIAERFQGGETIPELAKDYALSQAQVEEALRRETSLVTAA